MIPSTSVRTYRRRLTHGARLGVVVVVAFAVSGKAYGAKPLPPLPWDAIARSDGPVVVRKYSSEISEKSIVLRPEILCIGQDCWSVEGEWQGEVNSSVINRSPSEVRGKVGGWLSGTGVVVFQISAVSLASSRASVQNTGIGVVAGALLITGVGLPMLFMPDDEKYARTYLATQITSALRRQYTEDRTTYFILRDNYQACKEMSDKSLSITPAARASARASCDTFRAELTKNPHLADPFAEALTEANAAAAAWDAVPMLQRIASGDYLGFYQARDTFKLAALPEPVVADTCGRLFDATEGRAISDTTLRKKLAEWTLETCAQKQTTKRRRAKE